MLGCDANAHHRSWGSTDTNARGEALLEYIMGTCLVVCNEGHRPTFVVANRREVIDLTLTSLSFIDSVESWTVEEEVSFSDHRYITFDVRCDAKEPVRRRLPRRTDWTRYHNVLHGEVHKLQQEAPTNTATLESQAAALGKALTASFEAACPLKKVRIAMRFRGGSLS